MMPVGWNWKELHVFKGNPAPGTHRRTVAGVGVCIGCDLEHATESAGGEKDGLGGKDVQFAGGQFHGHDPF
jgi:hypothetical protein